MDFCDSKLTSETVNAFRRFDRTPRTYLRRTAQDRKMRP